MGRVDLRLAAREAAIPGHAGRIVGSTWTRPRRRNRPMGVSPRAFLHSLTSVPSHGIHRARHGRTLEELGVHRAHLGECAGRSCSGGRIEADAAG